MRLLVLLSLVSLTACHSGWDKDPFEGKDDTVKKAVPQGKNEVGIPPERDVMRIDVKSSHLLREGQKRTIPVKYRLLHPGYEFQKIEIPDLGDIIPGAEFDAATGEITIDTSKDIIPAGSVIFSSSITINLFALYAGVEQKVSKDVIVHVVRGDVEAPEFERVEGLNARYVEGSTDDFNIYIRDKASVEGPILSIGPTRAKSNNGAPFVLCPKKGNRVIGDLGLYRFECELVLGDDQDITKTRRFLNFEIQSVSQFGIPSDSKLESFEIFSSAVDPIFFADSKFEFQQGEKSTFEFVVVDPRDEGNVEAVFETACSSLAGPSECSCKTRKSISNCRLVWTPETHGVFSLKLKAKNTVNGTFGSMAQVKEVSHQIKLQVAPSPESPAEEVQ